jgi:hypothetical protein
MIAFDCPHCHKPLIVPNRKAGNLDTCPGCMEPVLVPEARPPAPGGSLRRFLPLVLLAAGIAGFYGWRSYQAREPERIQARFAAVLKGLSPQWQGIGWEKCDPNVGEYKLSVLYLSSRKRYTFAARSFTQVRNTSVVVDPGAQSQELANLVFTDGETESFRYSGGDPDERAELEVLTQELARALSQAAR